MADNDDEIRQVPLRDVHSEEGAHDLATLARNGAVPPACDGRIAGSQLENAWTERNARFGEQIGKALEERDMVSQLAASHRVAQWAYGR